MFARNAGEADCICANIKAVKSIAPVLNPIMWL